MPSKAQASLLSTAHGLTSHLHISIDLTWNTAETWGLDLCFLGFSDEESTTPNQLSNELLATQHSASRHLQRSSQFQDRN
jgi:hypothetical protein